MAEINITAKNVEVLGFVHMGSEKQYAKNVEAPAFAVMGDKSQDAKNVKVLVKCRPLPCQKTKGL
jgi:hypothetical protein